MILSMIFFNLLDQVGAVIKHLCGGFPFLKRLCQVCNQIEDEHHFLFDCDKNLDLRNKYLPLIFKNRSNIGEHNLCPSSLGQVGKIGSFIKQSLELRTGNS